MYVPDMDLEAGVAKLLARPWFRRTWVVQEVLLSRLLKIMIGRTCYDWSAMVQRLKQVDNWMNKSHLVQMQYSLAQEFTAPAIDQSGATSAGKAANARAEMVRFELPHCKLFDLLTETAGFQCADPRDRIFALISMFSPPIGLTPDYSSSVSQVYTALSVLLLEAGESQVLYTAGVLRWSHLRSNSMPSWVIDWRRPLRKGLLSAETRSNNWRAGFGKGRCMLRPRFVSDYTTLVLRGKFVDAVGYVAHPTSLPDYDRHFRVKPRKAEINAPFELEDWYEWEPSTRTEYVNIDGKLCEALRFQLITWDYEVDRLKRVEIEALHSEGKVSDQSDVIWSFRHMLSYNAVDGVNLSRRTREGKLTSNVVLDGIDSWKTWCSDEDNTDAPNPKVIEVAAPLAARCHDRRVFMTKNRIFGLGPAELEVGDAVCILLGVEVPFILGQTKRVRPGV